MPSRRYVQGWGALSLAVGAVLVTTAAGQAPPASGAHAANVPEAAVVRVDACAGAGGLCRVPRTTLALDGRAAVTLPAAATGPLDLALRTPGRLADVTVTDRRGRRIAGHTDTGGTRWTSEAALPAGDAYTARLVLEDTGPAGLRRRVVRLAVRTDRAPAGERLTVAFGPGDGGGARTYGVGQPVTAELSHPVPADAPAARRVVERALEVRSEPRAVGAWHWVDADTLHYRPRAYWPAGATVRVRSALAGARVTDRLYGGPSRPLTFSTGARVEAVTDVAAHEMRVYRDGRLLRVIPVTTGKRGFRTRVGTKVVLGKERTVRMRGDSIGIARGSREFYDLKVRWATRVTWSGEYLHAAPWSVDAQGSADVSHGCTGMSTEAAHWFYRTVREGDLVRVVNGYGETMAPFGNGYGDWNLDWPGWLRGSALGPAAVRAAAGSPLRPAL
ncbi:MULTISPECIES: L,D-transpeptidase [Streptomyces]|uniref:Ig-like domain-containing protein n=2 Tax=Streptomyces TaxID=1883 RepID=A0ABU4KED8_9ACTN|nr:Ig-like domain-containing protein [Streptomyces roseolus]MDX2296082.1 Ig-like domain-containing protein [Streptomyces roseolus]